jgi:hypothetical protein
MSTTTEAPRTGHTPGGPFSWENRAQVLAHSASRAALELPGVMHAEFRVAGGPSALVLHVDCRLRQQGDPSSTMKRIADSIVEDLENFIGVRFAERHLDFTISESPSKPAPAATAHPLVEVPGMAADTRDLPTSPLGDPLGTHTAPRRARGTRKLSTAP